MIHQQSKALFEGQGLHTWNWIVAPAELGESGRRQVRAVVMGVGGS